jgi:aminocarboxymuconate-semialdehyde decarboxylase
MINRRTFLSTTGRAFAGMAMVGGSACTTAQAPKQVIVGGRRMKVIDIHAHCLFPEVASVIAGTPMENADLGAFLALTPKRIDEMDARGIDIAALSVNRFWWYAADENQARQIVDINDRGLADWCSTYPDRFVALSSPAIQFPELAAEQLEFAVKELDHRGASVLGHVNGEVPTSEKYDPFWAKAEELGVPIFMHPNNAENLIQPGQLGNVGDLPNVAGNPLETAVFLTRMILEGTLDRFPNLKICASHGGGYLPSYMGRFEHACNRNNANCSNIKPMREYLQDQISIDSMVFSEEGLRHLVAEVGVSQIVYGSDMPFSWPDTIDIVVDAPFLTDAEKEAILSGNLMEMLKIS